MWKKDLNVFSYLHKRKKDKSNFVHIYHVCMRLFEKKGMIEQKRNKTGWLEMSERRVLFNGECQHVYRGSVAIVMHWR